MSAATTTAVVLDAVARDWRPTRVEARQVLRDAVTLTAQTHDGLVHIADVRPLLPVWLPPHSIGAYIGHLSRYEYLLPTGELRPNGGPSRNEAKPAMVRRLVKPIPEVTP